jgi:site-specific recombinase XerD
MARKPKPRAYNGGHITPTPHGTWLCTLWTDGKRFRKIYPTEAQAQGEIDRRQLDRERRTVPLTVLQLADAREALNLLPPGKTLTDAARALVQAQERPVRPVLVRDALIDIQAEKTALDRRERTAEGYRDHVGKFLRDSGEEQTLHCHEVTTDQIKAWLVCCGYRGNSWNGYRRTLAAFFAWAMREGMCATNPVDPIPAASVRREAPVCLPVASVRLFLGAVAQSDPALLPYFAVGFFTGARTAELDRWTADCWQPDCLHIGPAQAKTGQQRYLSIPANLAAWLQSYPATSVLRQTNHRKRTAEITKALNGFAWPRNAMRHSFASYHLAAHRNATLTAHELGHHSPALLYSTYRTLATEADGRAYFDLFPPNFRPTET